MGAFSCQCNTLMVALSLAACVADCVPLHLPWHWQRGDALQQQQQGEQEEHEDLLHMVQEGALVLLVSIGANALIICSLCSRGGKQTSSEGASESQEESLFQHEEQLKKGEVQKKARKKKRKKKRQEDEPLVPAPGGSTMWDMLVLSGGEDTPLRKMHQPEAPPAHWGYALEEKEELLLTLSHATTAETFLSGLGKHCRQ